MTPSSLESHVRRLALGWTGAGILLTLTLSLSVFIVLVFKDTESQIQNFGSSVISSHRTDLLTGDTRAIELQLKKRFGMGDDEDLLFLDSKMKPWVAGLTVNPIKSCKSTGGFCRDWMHGRVVSVMPIYFDAEGISLWGYLYIDRYLQPNWSLILSVVLAIVLGMTFQGLGFFLNLSRSIHSVSGVLSAWAKSLGDDPKAVGAYGSAPYAELAPIKAALGNLKDEIDALETSARLQGAVATLRGVGHDILNPVFRMKRILGLLEVTAKERNPSELELLGSLTSNLKRLSGYAEQLKQIQRSASASRVPAATDLSEEANRLVAELAHDPDANEKGVRIVQSYSGQCVTSADKDTMARVLENLLRNAIHASRPGGEIRVSAVPEDDFIALSVQDFGHGILPEHSAKVFEPGFTTKINTGTGLGLFVVKELCEKSGGNISLVSASAEGTTFIARFPSLLIGGNL
jgi:signal transduction histidine kinase